MTFSSLLTTAQEILPGAINNYKLNKAGINFDIVLSSRHVGQRAVSNRCSWKQHRSPQEQHAGEKLRFWAADIHTVHFSIHSRPNTKIHTLLQQLHTHTRLHSYCLKAEHAYKNTQLQPVGQCCWVETSSKEQKKVNTQAPLSLQKAPRFEENNTLRVMWHRTQQNKNTTSRKKKASQIATYAVFKIKICNPVT